MADSTHEKVQDYYGNTLSSTSDLATNVCTMNTASFSEPVKEARALIHPEIKERNYGCGAVFPESVEGASVLDLGSGAGQDCYILSRLVGEAGRVVGLDMTKEQLEVARKHIEFHTTKFGYRQPNVEFREGLIEDLSDAGIQDNSFNFIVSNCVINLSPDKRSVLKEAYRVLKPAGQIYFSDIYSNIEVPQTLRDDAMLWGECLSGALVWKELMSLAVEIGFAPPILVSSTPIEINNDSVVKTLVDAGIPDLKFSSLTYRMVKTPWDQTPQSDPLVDVTYQGTLKGHEKSVQFSVHGKLNASVKVPMPLSTAALLSQLPLDVVINGPSSSSASECVYPPLAGFLTLNPFDLTTENHTKKSSQGCCGGSKTCC